MTRISSNCGTILKGVTCIIGIPEGEEKIEWKKYLK